MYREARTATSTAYEYDLGPMRGNRSVIGVTLATEARGDRVRAIVQRHLAGVARRELRVAIDRTFPLAEAAAAHAYIEARNSFGRVLLIP